MSQIKQTPNGFQVIGILDNQRVRELFDKGAFFLNQVENGCSIDLSKIEYSDSAGLALLLDWVRLAKSMNKSLIFLSPPKQLHLMANLYGIDGFIIFQESSING
jgi:phospholipid transport system transporter-binding protein